MYVDNVYNYNNNLIITNYAEPVLDIEFKTRIK